MSETERIREEEEKAENETEEEPLGTESEENEDSAAEELTDTPHETAPEQINYAALAEEDMRYLITLFPHLEGKKSVAELDNPLRYAALRDLGLSPTEAYLATNYKPRPYDNRSHLQSAVPRRASSASELLSTHELEAARELFAGLSDREIQRLYKKVSK